MESLPDEVWYQAFQRMSVKDAARLCATSTEFRDYCQRYGIVEQLAEIEVNRIAPYSRLASMGDTKYVDTVRLIEMGQKTWYVFRGKNLSLPKEAMDDGELVVIFPGLIREPGDYVVAFMREQYAQHKYPSRLLKTQTDLDAFLSDLRAADDYYAPYIDQWILDDFRPLAQYIELGPDDGDQIQLVLAPVTVK
jgi:hypothetical protein